MSTSVSTQTATARSTDPDQGYKNSLWRNGPQGLEERPACLKSWERRSMPERSSACGWCSRSSPVLPRRVMLSGGRRAGTPRHRCAGPRAATTSKVPKLRSLVTPLSKPLGASSRSLAVVRLVAHCGGVGGALTIRGTTGMYAFDASHPPLVHRSPSHGMHGMGPLRPSLSNGDLVDVTSPGCGYRIELAARRGRPPARRETPASFKARRTVLAATCNSLATQSADRPSA